jgi:hypothetical protein
MSEQAEFKTHTSLCARVMPKLAGVVDGDETLSSEEQAHVESCLQCQAELVRYRKLLRALHELRTNVIRPVPGLLAGILDNLGEKGERRAVRSLLTGKRMAYTGGLAVATAAGLAGAVLLAGRGRGKGAKKAA